MALLKKILKSNQRETIVKWTGSGSDTLTLASIVSAGQTVTGVVNPAAVIVAASVTSSGATTITRNSEVALQINGNYEFQQYGNQTAKLTENSTSDIIVNLAAAGTCILHLRKTQGYSDTGLGT